MVPTLRIIRGAYACDCRGRAPFPSHKVPLHLVSKGLFRLITGSPLSPGISVVSGRAMISRQGFEGGAAAAALYRRDGG
jgi:hypothetical protein